MKTIAILFILCISQFVSGQFINPGLDQWDEPDAMKPFEHIVGWETLNRISYAIPNLSVTREEEGERIFARVQSNHAGQDVLISGSLYQKIAADNLQSITYTSRCDSIDKLGLCLVRISDREGILFSDTISVAQDSFDTRTIEFNPSMFEGQDTIWLSFEANGRTDFTEPQFDGFSVFDIDEVRTDFISSVDQQILDARLLDIHPNPSQGTFNLDLDFNLEATSVSVYNFLGQVVWMGPYTQELDLRHLANGSYIISVYTNQGVASERVLVER